jgi:hypothetical protein
MFIAQPLRNFRRALAHVQRAIDRADLRARCLIAFTRRRHGLSPNYNSVGHHDGGVTPLNEIYSRVTSIYVHKNVI